MSKFGLSRKGWQCLVAAFVAVVGFTSGAVWAAEPVPYRGPYTGPVGIGEPRPVMHLSGGGYQPVPLAPVPIVAPGQAPSYGVDVVTSTLPHKAKRHVAARLPMVKSGLALCQDNLASAKVEAAQAAAALKTAQAQSACSLSDAEQKARADEEKAVNELAVAKADAVQTAATLKTAQAQLAQKVDALSKAEGALKIAEAKIDASWERNLVLYDGAFAVLLALLVGFLLGRAGRKEAEPEYHFTPVGSPSPPASPPPPPTAATP